MTAMVLLSAWMESQVEFWRKTQYDGYDVSSCGRVRSFWRKGAPKRLDTWHVVKGTKDSHGYLFVEIRRESPNTVRRRFWIHREIALTFLDNPQRLPEVNHRTAVKTDNRVDNFEWISSAGNMQHATVNGLRDNARFAGESNWKAKFTEKDVRQIRVRQSNGERPVDIARDYPISIKHILARRTWKHIQ